MGYDLSPLNEDVEGFYLGAFSWPVLLEACGYYFACVQGQGKWYCDFAQDERMGDSYPMILSNDGFTVTEEEARVMARMARNFVAIQRTLPEENRGGGLVNSESGMTKGDVEGAFNKAMLAVVTGRVDTEPWPRKIRDDFVDKFERFAEWAERSGGFEVW